MASASSPQNSKKSASSSSKSYFRKTVCLKDWWLEKPENNSKGSPLAVAGITSREKQAVRLFSAPIWKRWDVSTLETVDGVFVIINGLMNKARTEANGFSSEICKHFVFGFPSDWEIYAKKCYGGEFPLSNISKRSQDFEPLSPLPNSIIKSPQRENCPGRTCTLKNLEEHFQDSLLSPCHMTTKGVPKKSAPAAVEVVNKTESCKKSLIENFLGSPTVLEVENHGQMHRELTNSVSNVIMSEDEDIMPKSGSVDGDNAIANAEVIPAYKSRGRGRPALKQTVNNNDTNTITPPIHHTSNVIMSEDEDIMPKSGSVDGDNAIENAEVIPAYKSRGRGRPALKQTVNNNDTKTITPPIRHTRRGLSSAKQKQKEKEKEKVGGVKQSISHSATPRSGKPENKSAYGNSTSSKRKDKSPVVSPLSSSFKRSRSGRLLLPKLEFWRNQIAFYDVDRRITAVKDLNLDALAGCMLCNKLIMKYSLSICLMICQFTFRSVII